MIKDLYYLYPSKTFGQDPPLVTTIPLFDIPMRLRTSNIDSSYGRILFLFYSTFIVSAL